MAIWLATALRTNKYRPVSAGEHCTVIQSVTVRFKDITAQIRLLVLVLTSPTCTYKESTPTTLNKILTDVTVTRRSKSTRHHWLLLSVVAEKVDTLLSLAACAGFTKSYTPTATSAVHVLDCVALQALFRSAPQDRAKLSVAVTSSYVGPLYPALHVQFQIDVEATADALVFTHDEHTVMPVRSAYVFAGQSMHVELPYTDLYLPSAHATHSGPYVPVYPGLQKQSVRAVAQESEYEFAEHVSHRKFPVMFLNVPGAHFSHRLAEAPVYPIMHPQS